MESFLESEKPFDEFIQETQTSSSVSAETPVKKKKVVDIDEAEEDDAEEDEKEDNDEEDKEDTELDDDSESEDDDGDDED